MKRTLKLAICDDEPSIVEKLAKKLTSLCPSGVLLSIDRYVSGETLTSAAEKFEYDCIFLDILLEKMNGIDTARQLREQGYSGLIVFVSNTDYYALKGYAVNAYGYFLKPLAKDTVMTIFDALLEKSQKTKLLISVKSSILSINTADIIYIESRGREVKIVTKDTIYSAVATLYSLEAQLDAISFARCHKGYILNFQYIREISSQHIIMENGETIPLGRNYKNEVRERFLSYLRI